MAKYYQDFRDKQTDSFPSGFTWRWHESNADFYVREKTGSIGGKTLEVISNDLSVAKIISYDAVDSDENRDNVEVVCRFRITSTNSEQLSVILRGGGSDSSKDGYLFAVAPSFGGYDLSRFKNNSWTLFETKAMTFEMGNWYWLRCRAVDEEGNARLQVKVWDDGDEEVEEWGISGVDTSADKIMGVGFVGFGKEKSLGVTDIDVIGIGTDGDGAPKELLTEPRRVIRLRGGVRLLGGIRLR